MMNKYWVDVKSNDEVCFDSYYFELDDVKGLDINEAIIGTDGLVWDRIAEERNITTQKAKDEFYVVDLYEDESDETVYVL